jgi:dTDP-4-dehydrorhamnose 3,5-epimerase
MEKIKTEFKDLYVFKSKRFKDNRGYFREMFIQRKLNSKIIFYVTSNSKKNVIRGLHFQLKKPQGKFLSVLKGKIYDIALDCRKNSKTFGKYYEIYLSEKNATSIYIPPGFAHGFLGLEKENVVMYGCTNYRHKESEAGIKWNDKDINIKWPIKKPILSNKDRNNKSFKFYFS